MRLFWVLLSLLVLLSGCVSSEEEEEEFELDDGGASPTLTVVEADDEDDNQAQSVAGDPSLSRDFILPLPLFPESAWTQTASDAAVLPESDDQILAMYRNLLGDTRSLVGDQETYSWPYMTVNVDDFAIPVFLSGDRDQTIVICEDAGILGWPHPKFDSEQLGGPVAAPGPAGVVRPAGPENGDADGHMVLYDPGTFMSYDFFAATIEGPGDCTGFRGGMVGRVVTEAGEIDFFDVRGPGVDADGVSSARAVGSPLLAGLILPEDVEQGVIAHALALATTGPRNLSPDPQEPLASDYMYPASTTETDFYSINPNDLASGQRIRLRQTLVDEEGVAIDESELAPITQMFVTALREYGAYVVDNSGAFTFYAEDYHTAVLHLTDDEVNQLIGEPPGTPLPEGLTKWQIVFTRLDEDLELIPFAVSPGDDEPDPETATIEVANFEVVEPATVP